MSNCLYFLQIKEFEQVVYYVCFRITQSCSGHLHDLIGELLITQESQAQSLDGTQNMVFDRAMTFANWLRDHYPSFKRFRDVDEKTVIEFMAKKTASCQSNTIQALLSALRKLQEGLTEINWIRESIVPVEWAVNSHNIPRGVYGIEDAEAIIKPGGCGQ
jgi:hypothetical protein